MTFPDRLLSFFFTSRATGTVRKKSIYMYLCVTDRYLS